MKRYNDWRFQIGFRGLKYTVGLTGVVLTPQATAVAIGASGGGR